MNVEIENREEKERFVVDDENLVNKVLQCYSEASEDVNVLDFVKINENAHTRFLKKILCKNKIFARSFVERMLAVSVDKEEEFVIDDQVTIEKRRRPDLVLESPSFYIVLENKVCRAGDGGDQINDYCVHASEHVKIRGNGQKAYLVYLTLAGGSPAESSLDQSRKEKMGNLYQERSYRHDILDWLHEDVLPKCLYSDRELIGSIKWYVNYVGHMSGVSADGDVTKKIMSLCQFGSDVRRQYKRVCNEQSRLQKDGIELAKQLASASESECEKDLSEKVRRNEMLFQVFESVRRELLNQCIYLDHTETAYNLKWILKNNPTLRYKNRRTCDIGRFASVSQFTYDGGKHVQCAMTHDGVCARIHILCTEEGIKHGPYCFADEMKKLGVDLEKLKEQGFTDDGKALYFSMHGFDAEHDELDKVAAHVEKAIKIIDGLLPV